MHKNCKHDNARGRVRTGAIEEETEGCTVSASKKRGAGRPPTFESPAEMQKKVDAYFRRCKGRTLKDKKTGRPLLNKWGDVVVVGAVPPTVTGLALALGFLTRKSLLDYEGKSAEFEKVLLRAKSRIEQYNEERLYDRDGCRGAQFNLQNNFKDWSGDRRSDIGDIEDLTPLVKLLED